MPSNAGVKLSSAVAATAPTSATRPRRWVGARLFIAGQRRLRHHARDRGAERGQAGGHHQERRGAAGVQVHAGLDGRGDGGQQREAYGP